MSEKLCLIDEETGEVLKEYIPGEIRIISRAQRDSCRKTDGGRYSKETMRMLEEGVLIQMESSSFVKCYNQELQEVAKELNTYEAKVLFILMNYLEYQTNCVTIKGNHTPTIEMLMEITGMKRNKLIESLKSLEKKHLMVKVRTGEGRRKYQYYINPWIATKGVLITASLRTMFGKYPIRTKGMKLWRDL